METKTLENIKAIAFDWSGTLSCDLIAVHMAVCTAWATYGIDVEHDPIAWAHHSRTSAKADLEARLAAARGCDHALADRLSRAIDDGGEYAKQYERALREVISSGKATPMPMAGVVQALKKLRAVVGPEFPLIVISAHPQGVLEDDIDRYDLGGKIFDEVIGDCINKRDALETFAVKHRIDPRNVAYVGDTRGDMIAARAAGVVSVAVLGGYHTREMIAEAHPDFTYDSAADFINRFMSEWPHLV